MTSDPDAPARERPVTLFLSYARADRASAQKLVDGLVGAGYTVWWDALIEGGAQFASSIRTALETADAVIVLWSRNSVDSDWVRDEAALGRDRHRLIPLALDGTQPPLGFRQYQAIDLSRWRGSGASREFTAIRRAIALSMGQEPVVAPAPARVSRRKAMAIGGGTAGVLALAGGGLLAWREGWLGGDAESLSIAVLPFRNLSGDEDQDYLSEGLTEEIRAALSRIPAMQVMAATSSNSVGREGKDAKDISRDLGVRYLLEGSVRRSGDRVRVAADLTDGRTGFSQWSQSVDRKLTDLFAFQSEIAATVAHALSVRAATARPAPGGTRNVRAYDAFLRGRALYNLAKDEESDRRALDYFDSALSDDPRFALAHAARSRVLASIAAQYARADQLTFLVHEALLSARRATDIAPDLAEGHLALGFATFTGLLKIRLARPAYDRAYQLGHGNGDIALLYALYCSRAGRAELAREAIGRALALDPLNPRCWRAAGSVAYADRRYADALDPIDKALRLNPDITNAHAIKAGCLMQLGRLAEARREFDAEPQSMFRLTGLAILDRRQGRVADARRSFDTLVADHGDAALYQQAEVLAQWGEHARALDALERALSVRDSGLIYLATDPLLDPIRKDPRFPPLLRTLTSIT